MKAIIANGTVETLAFTILILIIIVQKNQFSDDVENVTSFLVPIPPIPIIIHQSSPSIILHTFRYVVPFLPIA